MTHNLISDKKNSIKSLFSYAASLAHCNTGVFCYLYLLISM